MKLLDANGQELSKEKDPFMANQIMNADGEALRPPKILIAIPSHDYAPITFTYDAIQLASFTVSVLAGLPGCEVGVTLVHGTYIHLARQEIMEAAIAEGITHLLWLDSDMRFPQTALAQLLKHDKDVVGINYAQRGFPPDFVAIKREGGGDVAGEKLITSDDSTGLEEVEAIGFGCVLMKMSAMANLPEGEPWFWFDRTPWGDHVGEDVYFCRLLRERGVGIWVDHDLSKLCAHTGTMEYTTHHAQAAKEDGLT